MARPRRKNTSFKRVEKPQFRVNHNIRIREVRLVGDNVEQGIYSTNKAMEMAGDQGLDLVEIVPNANPPVCRIIDYSKFLYEKKRKEKEIKSKTQKTVVKEIRFGPNTDDHDFEFKCNHAERFLTEGAKVKAYVQFKGRSILFKDRGELILLKFAERLSEVGTLEQMPKLEGKRMFAFIQPKKTAVKKKPKKQEPSAKKNKSVNKEKEAEVESKAEELENKTEEVVKGETSETPPAVKEKEAPSVDSASKAETDKTE